MKIGIYFAYWEQEWDTEFFPYVSKVAGLGFDVLEIAGAGLMSLSDEQVLELRKEAERCGITLTVGIGLPPCYDVSSEDETVRRAGIEYMKGLIDKTSLVGAGLIGGTVFSHWPVDYSKEIHKEATRQQSIRSLRELADYAKPKNVTLMLEVLNRFEQYMFNDAKEGTQFVKEVDRENVKVMLDTFHMNIEEDSFLLPVLTVQPLVENAVKHGIAKKRGGGVVTIATRQTEQGYCITVSDTGVGFDVEHYMDDGKVHVGLVNVRQRLAIRMQATVDVDSTPGHGTTVTVTIPREKVNP